MVAGESQGSGALVEAKLLAASGQWSKAVARLEKVLLQEEIDETDVDNAELFYQYALCLFNIARQKNLEKLESRFISQAANSSKKQKEEDKQHKSNENNNSDSDSDSANEIFSDFNVAWDNAEVARSLIEKSSTLSILMLKIRCLLAEISAESGQYESAIEEYKSALDIREKISDENQKYHSENFKINLSIANTYILLENMGEAKIYFQKALKLADKCESAYGEKEIQALKAEISELMNSTIQELEGNSKIDDKAPSKKRKLSSEPVDVTHLLEKENLDQTDEKK